MIKRYAKYLNIDKYKNDFLSLFNLNFSHARTALKFGLKNYNLIDKKILVPEYICFEVVETLLQLNIDIIYYELNDDLSPNLKIINSSIIKSADALILVHYFGINQDIKKYINYCSNNELLLIEDNAHGLFGKYDDKYLGTFGHIGIISPRKSLNILNGGSLYIRNKKFNFNLTSQYQKKTIKWKIYQYIPTFFFNLLESINKNKFFIFKGGVIKNDNIKEYIIDKDSKKIINYQNIQLHKLKRQAIFILWSHFVKKNNLNPLFDVNIDNLSPLCFPILTKNIKERDYILKILHNNLIECYTWPTLPHKIFKQKSNGYEIMSKIICLPINVDIDFKKIKELTNTFSINSKYL